MVIHFISFIKPLLCMYQMSFSNFPIHKSAGLNSIPSYLWYSITKSLYWTFPPFMTMSHITSCSQNPISPFFGEIVPFWDEQQFELPDKRNVTLWYGIEIFLSFLSIVLCFQNHERKQFFWLLLCHSKQ